MKFFIYLSLFILILASFNSVECRRNSKKLKKNNHPGLIKRAPKLSTNSLKAVTNIQRPPVSVTRPVSTVVSRPTIFSGIQQGSHVGIVRGGIVARPLYLLRRYAVLRLRLIYCPAEFDSNLLVIERQNYCPEVCIRSFCVQIKEICCIYKEGLVDEI
jgi:hypothetical protein